MGLFHSSNNVSEFVDVSANTNLINNKIKTMIYTAIANGVTNIVHNLSFDPLHDELNILDLGYGNTLTEGVEYSNDINNISINLIGWSLNSGDKLKFQVIKGVK